MRIALSDLRQHTAARAASATDSTNAEAKSRGTGREIISLS